MSSFSFFIENNACFTYWFSTVVIFVVKIIKYHLYFEWQSLQFCSKLFRNRPCSWSFFSMIIVTRDYVVLDLAYKTMTGWYFGVISVGEPETLLPPKKTSYSSTMIVLRRINSPLCRRYWVVMVHLGIKFFFSYFSIKTVWDTCQNAHHPKRPWQYYWVPNVFLKNWRKLWHPLLSINAILQNYFCLYAYPFHFRHWGWSL